MSYNAAPKGFFGPGYSESAAAITLKTSEATGVSIGTFTVNTTTNVITISADHNLKVGDRLQFTTTGTLPAATPSGLSTLTDYYVLTVPSLTTITVSATKGGAVVDITDTGTGTHTAHAYGPLEELTDAEIDATGVTGDWRKIVFGIVEMLYQRWNSTPAADRPRKVTIVRTSSTNETTNEVTRYYTFQTKLAPTAVDVVDE